MRVLVILALAIAVAHAGVLLSNVSQLLFEARARANCTRQQPCPMQMQCVDADGNECAADVRHRPQSALCTNDGVDGGDGAIVWTCDFLGTPSSGAYRVEFFRIACEGESAPGDAWVRPGSCVIRYEYSSPREAPPPARPPASVRDAPPPPPPRAPPSVTAVLVPIVITSIAIGVFIGVLCGCPPPPPLEVREPLPPTPPLRVPLVAREPSPPPPMYASEVRQRPSVRIVEVQEPAPPPPPVIVVRTPAPPPPVVVVQAPPLPPAVVVNTPPPVVRSVATETSQKVRGKSMDSY
jgi:hypothetical protein